MERDYKQQELNLPETLGFRLRQMRKAKGLSIEDAADRLCLSVDIIKKIESDQYFDENNTIFTRGHIRSYARLLGFSQEEIQTHLMALGLITASMSVEPVKFNTKQPSAKDKPMKIATYAVIIILIILVLVWRYLNY